MMASNNEDFKKNAFWKQAWKLITPRHLHNFHSESNNKFTYRKLAIYFGQDWIFRQAETGCKSCEDWTEEFFLTDQGINHIFPLCLLFCNFTKHTDTFDFSCDHLIM